jgi:hypothetical protein
MITLSVINGKRHQSQEALTALPTVVFRDVSIARLVPIPPAVVAMLRKHRTEQKAERPRAGNHWQETGLVFTTEFGRPVDPAQVPTALQLSAPTPGLGRDAK